jgi:hypothetical protein
MIKSIISWSICLRILTLWVLVNLAIRLLGIALLLVVLAVSLLAVVLIIDWHDVIVFHVA